MKNFWKDYKELCSQTAKFYKDHWKGVIVLNAVVIGAELLVFKALEAKNQKEWDKLMSDLRCDSKEE